MASRIATITRKACKSFSMSRIRLRSGLKRTESGTLRLRKPGRMRWDYTDPAGKLFLSDGKNLYLYTPANNEVESSK